MSTSQTTGAGGTVVPADLQRTDFDARAFTELDLRDARGYRRPLATLPGYHKGRTPVTKGRTFPPDPPTVEEVVAIMNACPDTPAGRRARAIIVVLWRAGLRISEALDLLPRDLDPREGSVVVRHGKGDKRRIVAMDDWAWQSLEPWLEERKNYAPGPIFCVVSGPTQGTRAWASTDVRKTFRKLALAAGVEKRFAPHQLRHLMAVELWRAGIDLLAVQRQLGHARLDVTQLYLRSVAPMEALKDIRARPAPTITLRSR